MVDIKDFNYAIDSYYNTVNATYSLTEKAIILISRDIKNLDLIKKTKYGPEVLKLLTEKKNLTSKPNGWWSFVWAKYLKIKHFF